MVSNYTKSKTKPVPPRDLWPWGGLWFCLLLLAIGLLVGCDSPESAGSTPVSLQWRADTQASSPVQASLWGEIGKPDAQLALQITNSDSVPYTLVWGEVTLWPNGGLKAPVDRQGTITIHPSETYRDTVTVMPIHQTRYQQEYGWAGMPAQTFSLPLGFLKSSTWDSTALRQITLHRKGSESTLALPAELKLFRMSPDNAWVNQQISHWQGVLESMVKTIEEEAAGHGHEVEIPFNPEQKPFVNASVPELTCGGINFRAAAHQWGDSLYLDLRLVNHSPFALWVPLATLKPSIAAEGKPRLIGSLQGLESDGRGNIWVKKGERIVATLIYPLRENTDNWEIPLETIRLKEIDVPAFHSPLAFTKAP